MILKCPFRSVRLVADKHKRPKKRLIQKRKDRGALKRGSHAPSWLVTLPAEWIRINGLGPKDAVLIEPMEDGSLKIKRI
jgi:hypothetical protein